MSSITSTNDLAVLRVVKECFPRLLNSLKNDNSRRALFDWYESEDLMDRLCIDVRKCLTEFEDRLNP